MRRFLVVNGPNLNLLGKRDPDIYGNTTHQELEDACHRYGAELDAGVEVIQTNHEGTIIDLLHSAEVDGIVLNAGAYTHTSYALRDAIDAIEIPVIEVHISNILEREPWRAVSLIRSVCAYSIYGRGIEGYRWAMRRLVASEHPPIRLSYGDSEDQYADLRTPPTGQGKGMAVLVHGGFWRHLWTADTTELVALDLVGRGVTVLNVEYRRIGAGGDAHNMIEDVAGAVAAGIEHTGLDQVVLIGHSAGAQLALMAARKLAVSLVVAMGGVLDLERALSDDLGRGAVSDYVGSNQVDGLSPTARPNEVPTFLVHGADDTSVPPSQAESYIDAAAAAGSANSQLAILPDCGHFEFLEPQHPAWKTVADRVVATLSSGE